MKCVNKTAVGFICIGFGAGVIVMTFMPKWCILGGVAIICCGVKLIER